MKGLPPTCENKMVLSSLQKKIEMNKNYLSNKIDNEASKDFNKKEKSSSTLKSGQYPRVKSDSFDSQNPYNDKEELRLTQNLNNFRLSQLDA
jgi:hypothetical protein